MRESAFATTFWMYVLNLKLQSRNFHNLAYLNDFPNQGKHLPGLPKSVKSGSESTWETETRGLMSVPLLRRGAWGTFSAVGWPTSACVSFGREMAASISTLERLEATELFSINR
jgi:hypothetical protein